MGAICLLPSIAYIGDKEGQVMRCELEVQQRIDELRKEITANNDHLCLRIIDYLIEKEAFDSKHRVSLSELAKGTGINPGTIYRLLFGDKKHRARLLKYGVITWERKNRRGRRKGLYLKLFPSSEKNKLLTYRKELATFQSISTNEEIRRERRKKHFNPDIAHFELELILRNKSCMKILNAIREHKIFHWKRAVSLKTLASLAGVHPSTALRLIVPDEENNPYPYAYLARLTSYSRRGKQILVYVPPKWKPLLDMLVSPTIDDKKLAEMAYLYYSIVVGENCKKFTDKPTSEGNNCVKFATNLISFSSPPLNEEESTTNNNMKNLKTGGRACPCESVSNQYRSDLTDRKERVITATPSQPEPTSARQPQPDVSAPLTGVVAAESGVSSLPEVDLSTTGDRETDYERRFRGGREEVFAAPPRQPDEPTRPTQPHRASQPASPQRSVAPAGAGAADGVGGKLPEVTGGGEGGLWLDGREWGWRWRLGDGLYLDGGLVLGHNEAVKHVSSLLWEGSEEDDIFLTFDSVPPIGTAEGERFGGEEPDFSDDDSVDELELWWIMGFPHTKEVIGARPSHPMLVWARSGYKAQKWLWNGKRWLKVGEYDFLKGEEREAFRWDRDQPRVGCFGLTKRGRRIYLWYSDKKYRWVFVGSCYFDPDEPVKFFLKHDPRRKWKRERREICTEIHPLRSWAFLPTELNEKGACAKCGDYHPRLLFFSVPKSFEYKIRRFQRRSNWKASAGNLVLMFSGCRVCEGCMRQIQYDLMEVLSRLAKDRETLLEAAIYTGLLEYNPEWEERSPWLAFFYRLRHWTQFLEFRFRATPSEFMYIDGELLEERLRLNLYE
jgi:hypothetical protein